MQRQKRGGSQWSRTRSNRNRSSVSFLRQIYCSGHGATVGEASRKQGVTEQTYYRWRKEYGGMRVEQAKRLKELEKENTRLKKLVADISPDNTNYLYAT